MPENQNTDKDLTPVQLRYKKGELIIKEGDFGLSIYKVVKGRVDLFTDMNGKEVSLTTIGPGAVIGEMIFLNDINERRPASARAVDDSLLEVWHPDLLRIEYEQMPSMIKYLADQTLSRLQRTNKLVVQMTEKRRKELESKKGKEPWIEQRRRYYRKKVHLAFTCKSLNPNSKYTVTGEIFNISQGGAGLEVNLIENQAFPFGIGEEFVIQTILPNESNVEFPCRLASMKEGKSQDILILGVSFFDVSEHSAKNLGFFLMP